MVKKIIAKPHLFFFFLIPISLVLGFIFKNESLGFDYLGTYLSFKYITLFSVSAVFFGLIGLNYFSLLLLKKQPRKWLTLFHILFQVIALVVLVYYILSNNNFESIQQKNVINFTFFIGFILFLTSILIHLINFFISLAIKK